MSGSALTEAELRSKYYDWCSAWLAERFLRLTPEEVYELAGRVDVRPATYAAVIGRVTEALRERHPLPGFEEWVAAYRTDPERFEADLAGLDRSPPDP